MKKNTGCASLYGALSLVFDTICPTPVTPNCSISTGLEDADQLETKLWQAHKNCKNGHKHCGKDYEKYKQSKGPRMYMLMLSCFHKIASL